MLVVDVVVTEAQPFVTSTLVESQYLMVEVDDKDFCSPDLFSLESDCFQTFLVFLLNVVYSLLETDAEKNGVLAPALTFRTLSVNVPVFTSLEAAFIYLVINSLENV